MSETLNNIKDSNEGYIAENYGENTDVLPISEILRKEMLEFRNINIPVFLEKCSLLDLIYYNLTTVEFMEFINRDYSYWLKLNHLSQNSKSLELFKNDCYFKKIQQNATKIIGDIEEIIVEYFNTPIQNILGVWLTTEECSCKQMGEKLKYILPENYLCLLDMDDEGVLFAMKTI